MTINQQTLEGNWTQIKGKLRERWGHLSGDELESARGNVDQLVGAIQQKTGEARESVEKYLEKLTDNGASMIGSAAESARHYAETAQQSVQDAAHYASDAVRSGYITTQRTIRNRPVESLAVSFGAGLITGVVLGLIMRSR